MDKKIKLIAELSWCHMGDMMLAQEMICAAAESGADYAKFQTWKVERLKPGPWDNDGRRDIYNKAELSHEDHFTLQAFCETYDIKFLTSCFCEDDLSFIREVTNEVKIPSTECFNVGLVTRAVNEFDTVYMSTGASLEQEYLPWTSKSNVYPLHCVSSYPCDAKLVNLQRLKHLLKLTPRAGYSGHYQGIWDAIAAITIGAAVVEKHFTIDNNLPGRDNKFAILPDQFAEINEYREETTKMFIDHGADYQECEAEARSIYAKRWSS